MKVGDILYRCVSIHPNMWAEFETYRVVRLTPCGMWIRWTFHEGPEDGDYFDIASEPVWRSATTRFCSPTKEEALTRYFYRKKSHLKHLRRKLADVEEQFKRVTKAIAPKEGCAILRREEIMESGRAMFLTLVDKGVF